MSLYYHQDIYFLCQLFLYNNVYDRLNCRYFVTNILNNLDYKGLITFKIN